MHSHKANQRQSLTEFILSCLVLNMVNYLTLLSWLPAFVFLLNLCGLTTATIHPCIVRFILHLYVIVVSAISGGLVLTPPTLSLLTTPDLEFSIGFPIAMP
jgi:hypothetical protein